MRPCKARPRGPSLLHSFVPRKLALENIVPSQLAKATVVAPSPTRLFYARLLAPANGTSRGFRKLVATAYFNLVRKVLPQKLLCRLRKSKEKRCVNVSYEGRALWCKVFRTNEGKTKEIPKK